MPCSYKQAGTFLFYSRISGCIYCHVVTVITRFCKHGFACSLAIHHYTWVANIMRELFWLIFLAIYRFISAMPDIAYDFGSA